MDLQCILYIVNSSYAVKTPKDKVTCDIRDRDQTGGRETAFQTGVSRLKWKG